MEILRKRQGVIPVDVLLVFLKHVYYIEQSIAPRCESMCLASSDQEAQSSVFPLKFISASLRLDSPDRMP